MCIVNCIYIYTYIQFTQSVYNFIVINIKLSDCLIVYYVYSYSGGGGGGGGGGSGTKL